MTNGRRQALNGPVWGRVMDEPMNHVDGVSLKGQSRRRSGRIITANDDYFASNAPTTTIR